jgi:1-acyl-sn-glycerol-3-phosphate acyltransferase
MNNYQRMDKLMIYHVTLGLVRIFILVLRLHCNVNGVRHHPPGAKILAVNHPNMSDGFYIPLVFPERIFTLMHVIMFDIPAVGWLFAKSGQIPVIPGKKLEAFQRACEVLRQGYSVMIFPEGRLNPEQETVQAGSGAVCLSIKTGAPIVPVGVYVSQEDTIMIEYWQNNIKHSGRWQVRGCCYICLGQPWYPSREAGELNGQAATQLTEILMEKIYSLSAQAAQQAGHEQALPCQFLHQPEEICTNKS